MADSALIRLSSDIARKVVLERVQVPIVEELSVIPAEIFSCMSMILQDLRDNYEPFGGVVVIANGDCLQLPNVSGCDVFLSTSLLFGFNFHFLRHLVHTFW